MPYQRDRDLPSGVRDNLPTEARSLWRRVFNAVEKEESTGCTGGDPDCMSMAEDKARQAAWGSVKRQGYTKGEDGNWSKKELVSQWEEICDTFEVIPASFRAISERRATSAVINTRCRRTGGHRWITVSSGTFPDRMEEIVSLHAQEYSLAWAERTGHYGPLRLAHIPNPVTAKADIRAQWKALVGEYIMVFDKGILPMADIAYQKSLRFFSAPSETRIRNLMAMVGKDLTQLVVTGQITADIGTCDYQVLQGGNNPKYPGRFLVESGLYDDGALAYRARRHFDVHPGEVSIGFLYDRMRLMAGQDGVVYPSYFRRMWRFERSLLPMGRAAFPASYLDGAMGIATV